MDEQLRDYIVGLQTTLLECRRQLIVAAQRLESTGRDASVERAVAEKAQRAIDRVDKIRS